MGMPDIPCDVEMVFMLAIADPNAQLDFFRTLMRIFQISGKLRALKGCEASEELVELFASYFI
jgi:mannitol/fructose-specific phosphotransferase system IIA component (Ntr-type)